MIEDFLSSVGNVDRLHPRDHGKCDGTAPGGVVERLEFSHNTELAVTFPVVASDCRPLWVPLQPECRGQSFRHK